LSSSSSSASSSRACFLCHLGLLRELVEIPHLLVLSQSGYSEVARPPNGLLPSSESFPGFLPLLVFALLDDVLGRVLRTCGADAFTCGFRQVKPPEVPPERTVTRQETHRFVVPTSKSCFHCPDDAVGHPSCLAIVPLGLPPRHGYLCRFLLEHPPRDGGSLFRKLLWLFSGPLRDLVRLGNSSVLVGRPLQLLVDGVRGSTSSLRQRIQYHSGVRCEIDLHPSPACNRINRPPQRIQLRHMRRVTVLEPQPPSFDDLTCLHPDNSHSGVLFLPRCVGPEPRPWCVVLDEFFPLPLEFCWLRSLRELNFPLEVVGIGGLPSRVDGCCVDVQRDTSRQHLQSQVRRRPVHPRDPQEKRPLGRPQVSLDSGVRRPLAPDTRAVEQDGYNGPVVNLPQSPRIGASGLACKPMDFMRSNHYFTCEASDSS
jgi:hypothetical protein